VCRRIGIPSGCMGWSSKRELVGWQVGKLVVGRLVIGSPASVKNFRRAFCL
jgi:hypothetical protein